MFQFIWTIFHICFFIYVSQNQTLIDPKFPTLCTSDENHGNQVLISKEEMTFDPSSSHNQNGLNRFQEKFQTCRLLWKQGYRSLPRMKFCCLSDGNPVGTALPKRYSNGWAYVAAMVTVMLYSWCFYESNIVLGCATLSVTNKREHLQLT